MSQDFLYAALLGSKAERERVVKYLKRRVAELKECRKDDTCNDLWHFAQGLIEDITEGEH
jgi:hypothetical protein